MSPANKDQKGEFHLCRNSEFKETAAYPWARQEGRQQSESGRGQEKLTDNC